MEITIKILSYKMSVERGLDFDQIELQEVNLFVGITGSGKSQLLDSILMVARFAIGQENVNEKNKHLTGSWSLEIEINNKHYKWTCSRLREEDRSYPIQNEIIEFIDKKSGEKHILIERTKEYFKFNNDLLPKLDPSTSCINLLKHEDDIKPIYNGFMNVLSRNFSHNVLSNSCIYAGIDKTYGELFSKKETLQKGLYSLFNMPLSIRLFFLNENFNEKYREIITSFKELFPTIEDCFIVDAHKEKIILSPGLFTPVFMVKEKGIEKRIDLANLASGMIKVLLILTDVISMPDGFIYEMDEYENSLGINVINFLPSILLDHQSSKQFLISTHHPYLINKIPINHWYVLSRDGRKVSIQYGETLISKYSASSQESFIKLINDPFYFSDNK